MTLPVSGPISLSQVNVELGLSVTSTISLNDTNVRALAGLSSGVISMYSLYGRFQSFAVVAYGIGAGGKSASDTKGGAGGGGAVVKTFMLSPGGVTSCSIIVGSVGPNGSVGGTSSLTTNVFTVSATGGQPGSIVPCGGCAGNNVSGGNGVNGDINLSGGYGMGWNQRYGDGSPINGGNGANSGIYYAAGGGGGGNDYGANGTGGNGGGLWAGRGGNGVRSGTGGNASNYGGGGGGSGNNGGAPGAATNGVFVLTYTASRQLADGGAVSSSGSGASTVWTHLFTSDGTFTPK